MSFLNRISQRVLIFLIIVGTLWFITSQVFERLDQKMPLFVALFVTYILSAYIILPQIIHFSLKILRRGRIPKTTHAFDGLPADPVNIILLGSKDELFAAFAAAGWHKADRLAPQSALKMAISFMFNKPYPEAPFSSLYLFGRKQDLGFQEAIGHSPRKRNHIRFWPANIDPRMEISNLRYWLKKQPVDLVKSHIWVGAGSEDLGFGLTKLTFQISHRVGKNVDKERDHILDSLEQSGSIHDKQYVDAGELVAGKYISDGKILYAKLASFQMEDYS
jgi:hypothetical protein